MTKNIRLDDEKQFYVVTNGYSESAIGYEEVFAVTGELASRLGQRGISVKAPVPSAIGSKAQYLQYQRLLTQYAELDDPTTWFDSRTPQEVKVALEQSRRAGVPVRLFYGHDGLDALMDWDNVGTITRSATGPLRCPVLTVGREEERLITSHFLVRICRVDTNQDLYRHPQYRLPLLSVQPALPGKSDCEYDVYQDAGAGSEFLRTFPTESVAMRWVSYLKGDIHSF